MPAAFALAMNCLGHRGQRDAHAAGRRAGDAGERGDGDRLVDQRVGDRCAAPSATTRKPGSAAITAPKPYSEAVFMDASRAPATAALRAFGERRGHRPPGEHQHGQDAEQQRAFDGPDRGHCGTTCVTIGFAVRRRARLVWSAP